MVVSERLLLLNNKTTKVGVVTIVYTNHQVLPLCRQFDCFGIVLRDCCNYIWQ